ncbi:MAG TPA: glycine/sarcosine/betaine reductase component B subunit [Candidatus Limnocylindrales bacterium]|nr:glycine/sarcosine/betaine reductase component B subunit [Candidatus Limnocylindrales bacterium]
MRLELHWSRVDEVVAGAATRLASHRLSVDLEDLRARLGADARLGEIRLDLAHPGESCRIGRVFDVMAPRAKMDGGEDYPGVLGALHRAGRGRTRALAGVSVVVTDQQLENVATSTLALIDMTGPVADLSPFGRTHNLVVSARPAPGAGRSEYLAAVRMAGLKAGVVLAQAAVDVEPDEVEVFELPSPARVPVALQHLPRVAYVFQIHSHQRPTGIDEGILYGDPVRRMLPTLIHPNEVLDGAVLRGFMGRAVTTHAIQSHPVIRSLYAAHGKTLWFSGVVVTVAQATEPERVRSAAMAAGLVADILGADGALLTKIGGGAPHVDMAQAAAQCEALGVKTTLIVEDMSTDGTQEGMLLFNFPGMNALVNVGSAQQRMALPAVERVIGADDLAGALRGKIETTYGGICGAIEQVGASRVTALIH